MCLELKEGANKEFELGRFLAFIFLVKVVVCFVPAPWVKKNKEGVGYFFLWSYMGVKHHTKRVWFHLLWLLRSLD